MKKRDNKFTLVELLVVIGIASLLMGLVLPAFSRMVTGSAVDRLASNLKLRLERAQSEAASSRRDVALILPNGSDVSFTGANEWNAARLGGSRMCYVTTNAAYEGAFVAWVPDETWTLPERGARLIYAGFEPGNIAATGSAQRFGANVSSPNLRSSIADNGTTPVAAEKPLKDITGTCNASDCAIIFSPNGNIRSTRDVYLAVAEAADDGTSLFFPGGVAYNFRALKINYLTGNVEYVR